MEPKVRLVVKHHKDKRIVVAGVAEWVAAPAHGHGQAVGRLVHALELWVREPGQVPRKTGIVPFRAARSEVVAHGPVAVELRKGARGDNVKVHVAVARGVPKEEPVLLDQVVRRRSLELCAVWVGEGHVKSPAFAIATATATVIDEPGKGRWPGVVARRPPARHQPAEIPDPLPKARKARVAPIDRIGPLRSVKDARVVRPDIEAEILELAHTLARIPGGRADGQDPWTAKPTPVRANAGQLVVDKQSLADQLDAGLQQPCGNVYLALRDNDPRIVALWVRHDVGVERVLGAEADREVLAVLGRGAEDLRV